MAAAFALAIFRGKNIFIFGIAERLRTLRYPIFTGGVVEENGICGAAGFYRPRRAADTDVTRKNSFIFGVQESLRVFLYPFFTGWEHAFDKSAKKTDPNSSSALFYQIFQEIVYTMPETVVLYKIV